MYVYIYMCVCVCVYIYYFTLYFSLMMAQTELKHVRGNIV
jgi:hypothetical protein